MPTDTIYGSTNDGSLRGGSNTSWADARSQTDALSSGDSGTKLLAGYGSASAGDERTYTIGRAFVEFDTSSIPDTASITSATLNLYAKNIYDNGANLSICVVAGTPASDPPANADFDQIGTTELATRATYLSWGANGSTSNAYKTLTLNSSGRSHISLTGTTTLALITSADFDNSAPTATKYAGAYVESADVSGTSNDPYLEITYSIPTTRTYTADGEVVPPTQAYTADAVVCGATYDAAVLSNAPSSYWELSESSGTSIADSGSNGYTGTATGVTLAQVGVDGDTSAYFDSTDRVDVGANYSLASNATFTLSCWIRPDNVSGGKAIAQRLTTGGFNLGWTWILSGNVLLFERLGGGSYTDSTGSTTLSANVWTHIAVTYDGSDVRFYVNGQPDSAGALSNTRAIGASSNNMLLGNYPSPYGLPLTGRMAKFAVWGSALSAGTIQAHYLSGSPDADSGTRTYTADGLVQGTAERTYTADAKVYWPHAPTKGFGVGTSGKWDDYVVYAPRVAMNLDGTPYQDSSGYYYIYYTASGSTAGTDRDRVGLVRTTDFVTFTKYSTDSPVLGWGASGTYDASGSVWDGTDVAACSVLHDGTQFLMFFEGNSTANEVGDNIQIGVASSSDGITWTKYASNPILTFGANSTDAGGDLFAPVVIKDGSTWKMWYGGHSGSHQPSSYGGTYGVMYATASSHLGPWTKYSNSYVFKPSGNIGPEQVTKSGGTYTLTYADYDTLLNVGQATSSDGITWTDRGYVMRQGTSGAWDDGRVYWTNTFADGGLWRLVYSGYDGTTVTSFGVGAVTVGDRNTRTFTADALVINSVASRTTRTFTADAVVTVVAVTTTVTFTADAIVETATPVDPPPNPSPPSTERRHRAYRRRRRGGEW